MIALVAALVMGLQENVPPAPGDIEQAIKRGTTALIARCSDDLMGSVGINSGMGYDYVALVLYTLVHSGIGLQDPTVQGFLAKVAEAPLVRTYQVALTAAALAAVDPGKYQGKLAQCAQYLVDWQAENGQWGYGDKYDPPIKPASAGPNQTIARIPIKRAKKLGGLNGDNSNSQYAILGLKACFAGGCDIDSGTLTRAMDWLERSQQKDGGWSYHFEGTYQEKLGVYGSMTAGAVSALIMIKQMKNSDPKVTSSIIKGIAWLAENFSVEKNVGAPSGSEVWHHYYLYALERVGDLYPTEKFGKRAWYAIGATYLLKTQRADGTWRGEHIGMEIADTCFALLFLERVARRPPVATGGKPAATK